MRKKKSSTILISGVETSASETERWVTSEGGRSVTDKCQKKKEPRRQGEDEIISVYRRLTERHPVGEKEWEKGAEKENKSRRSRWRKGTERKRLKCVYFKLSCLGLCYLPPWGDVSVDLRSFSGNRFVFKSPADNSLCLSLYSAEDIQQVLILVLCLYFEVSKECPQLPKKTCF